MSTHSWTARPASLIDVTHIVRLADLADHAGDIADQDDRLRNVSGDLVVERFDATKVGSTARLFLSHGALEHGKVFVAEDDDGIAGASVWLPSDIPNPVGVLTEFARLLEREVGITDVALPLPALSDEFQLADATVGLLTSVEESQAEWLLVAVLTRPDLLRDIDLLEVLVTPMLELKTPLAALVLRPVVAHALTRVGFNAEATVIVSPNPPHELEISLLTRG